jgi:hypothetical protein
MTHETNNVAARFDRLPDPVYIGGYMRSGTSFVMKLLQGHVRTTGFKTDADLLGPILNAWLPEGGQSDPYTGIMAVMKRDVASIRRLVRANWFFVYEYVGRPIFQKRIVEKTPDSQGLFARMCEVFPQASFVVVIREPVASVRSALAHALLFYPAESTNVATTIERIVTDWTQSMEQTREAARMLGDRLLLVNFDEFVSDVPAGTRAMFEWCGLEAGDDAVGRAIAFAGSPDDERTFWLRILDWPEDEFARRYGMQLDQSQRDWVAARTLELFQEVNALRVQASRSTNRPDLPGASSGAARTTATPGS